MKSRQEWWENFLLQGQLSVLTVSVSADSISVSVPPLLYGSWHATARLTCTRRMWLE